MLRIGPVAEDAERNGAVDSLAQLDEEQGQFVSLLSETVSLAMRDPFDEAVEAQFAQVITDLVEGVVLWFEAALVQNGVAQLGGGPTFEMAAGSLEQYLQKAEDAFLLQLDARDLGFALDDWLARRANTSNWPCTLRF